MSRHYPTSLVRAVVRAISYAGFQLRRRDHSGDIYPSDEAAGFVGGPCPDRIIVIGEATAMGYGVLTHELGLASRFARQHSARSGRGAEWWTIPIPENLIGNAPQLIHDIRGRLAYADIVIVVAGIVDTLSLTTSTAWRRQLTATLDSLRLYLPMDALILVPRIPPLSQAGAIPPIMRWASSHQAELLNRVSSAVLTARPSCGTVDFPSGLDNQLWHIETSPAAYRGLYSTWAAALVDAVTEHTETPASLGLRS